MRQALQESEVWTETASEIETASTGDHETESERGKGNGRESARARGTGVAVVMMTGTSEGGAEVAAEIGVQGKSEVEVGTAGAGRPDG